MMNRPLPTSRRSAIRYGRRLGAESVDGTLEDIYAGIRDADAMDPDFDGWAQHIGEATSFLGVPRRWWDVVNNEATRTAVGICKRFSWGDEGPPQTYEEKLEESTSLRHDSQTS